MAEVTINNSPIHSDSIITALYGETGQSWSGIHTGSDFAPYGSTPANPDLYSVCNGVVVNVIDYDPLIDQALGNQVVIRDNSTNYYWRYCHMATPSPLAIGDNVDTNTKVGVMGDTGNAFGVHLHLEYSSVSYWDTTRTKFFNPLTELGIPNERGTIVKYNGTTPPTPVKKSGFKWQIFTRPIRNRREFDIE